MQRNDPIPHPDPLHIPAGLPGPTAWVGDQVGVDIPDTTDAGLRMNNAPQRYFLRRLSVRF